MKKQTMIRVRWILAAVFVLAAGCFYGCGQEEGQVVRLSGESRTEGLVSVLPGGEDAQAQEIPGSDGGQSTGSPEAAESGARQVPGHQSVPGSGAGQTEGLKNSGQTREESGVCYVHVCGEVASPGVYRLTQGQRIYEAVEAAGGFTPQASRTWLNLAEKVQDGMKLEVPDLDTAAKLQSSRDIWGASGKPAAADGSSSGAGDGRININTATREELMRLSGIGEARAEDIISYRQEKGYFQTIEDIMKVPGIKNAAFQKIKDDIVV